MDAALLGSMWTGGLGVLTLIVSRIRCIYKRTPDGECMPSCGCTEGKLREDHEEVTIHEVTIGDTPAILLLPRK